MGSRYKQSLAMYNLLQPYVYQLQPYVYQQYIFIYHYFSIDIVIIGNNN